MSFSNEWIGSKVRSIDSLPSRTDNIFYFDPMVWGPHFWFVLHTISITYPTHPNSITKRKYYDFIQNLPLFLPSESIGNKFSEFLDKYPVTPYLDSRESFIRWVHFIHNKVNVYLGKEEYTLYETLDHYYEQYLPVPIKKMNSILRNKHIWYSGICLMIVILILSNRRYI